MARPLTALERALREAVERKPRQAYCFGRPFELASTEEIIAAQVAQQNGFKHRWPVLKDPIFTPLFTALFSTTFLGGAATWTLFGGAISAATVAAAIATTALSIGLQYLLAPKPPKPEDGRQPMTQPIPYRFYGVGECRAAGAFVLWESKDASLASVQAIMAHRIQGNAAGDGYVTYWLNDDEVELISGKWGTTEYPDRYRGYVTIGSRLGLVPETAYSNLVTLLSSDGVYTNDHRGDGQASLSLVCKTPNAEDFTTKFPYGRPAPSVVGRWARCWDFRDADQDPRDPDTWRWTKNTTIQLCWHLCFNPFGELKDYRRAILPVIDMWQEEADVCDELVSLASGGTEKRYESSLVNTTENGPKAFTNALLAAMDGWMCTRGDGAVLVVAGKFREKYCATLTDDEIVGYQRHTNVLFDEEVNQLTPKFNYPATGYSSTNTDFFEDSAAQIVAGRVLPQTANYDAVTAWRQARRLGKRDWVRLQQKETGQLYVNLGGLNAVYAPWARIQSNAYKALDGKVISNRNATINLMQGGFQIDYAKMPDSPADIDLWTPSTDEGSAPPVPSKPVSDGIPKPIIDSLTVISSGGAVYLRVLIADPQRDDLTPKLRYRIHDIGDGTPGAWVDQLFTDVEPSAGTLLLNSNTVPGDQHLDVVVVFVGANAKNGPASDTESIVSTVDTVAPQALVSFSAGDGTGQFIANVSTENDSHLVSIAIYCVVSGGTLDRATDLAARPAVSPGISYAIPVTADAGTWDIYAEPLNRSGIAGPLSGPATVTVT